VAAWPETCEKSAQDVLKTVNCEPRIVNGYDLPKVENGQQHGGKTTLPESASA
jgi:hypothetical protein